MQQKLCKWWKTKKNLSKQMMRAKMNKTQSMFVSEIVLSEPHLPKYLEKAE
jgi:hypothetical protein